MYENAFLQMNFLHIKILWKLLISEKISDEEGDVLFQFLCNIMHEKGNNFFILHQKTSTFIFFELLSKLKIQEFSLKAFFCYEIFFLKVNIINKFLDDENENNYLTNLKII
jgi:hypothetical protein